MQQRRQVARVVRAHQQRRREVHGRVGPTKRLGEHGLCQRWRRRVVQRAGRQLWRGRRGWRGWRGRGGAARTSAPVRQHGRRTPVPPRHGEALSDPRPAHTLHSLFSRPLRLLLPYHRCVAMAVLIHCYFMIR